MLGKKEGLSHSASLLLSNGEPSQLSCSLQSSGFEKRGGGGSLVPPGVDCGSLSGLQQRFPPVEGLPLFSVLSPGSEALSYPICWTPDGPCNCLLVVVEVTGHAHILLAAFEKVSGWLAGRWISPFPLAKGQPCVEAASLSFDVCL